MTEAEWLACTDPQKMLEFLRGRASGRKLRLFACACCQRILPLFTDERSRRAVEVAEQFADGLASPLELEIGRVEAKAAIPTRHPSKGLTVGGKAWREAKVTRAVARAAWDVVQIPVYASYAARQTNSVAEQRGLAWKGECWQPNLLRDIFGNPFHPVTVDPPRLTWNGNTIPKLALSIYEERHFADLPVLADALEEAGCTDIDILDHCRRPGEHVRGCWVVDLLLGKS